ncbi:MAG: lipid-A-disaccharide synthase N-terminal domain-containing protein [Phycisphaerae bacterium]|jgi:lipid-A-disaccharide synthase-like uncharacterized protein|nr:lipid-A-disaccharide synthase N-terminal domain-containing protein [Phycisphaerae bacterium]MCZ2400469.1 lipid-A-disaccharide synthase N-terminal domain-containing protein [Phycisphaerae bacterium]NUQ50930.1 lipid-A-disaccharide synthase N-terminal domain-containing protein [Phycisphaerae bacterium]
MTLAAWQLADLLNPLVLFGFAGQFVFMLRFLVQWYASESRGRSVVPVAFWYISVLGGLILLTYAILREDIVFSAGQALGLLIYLRNIWLIHSRRRRYAARQRTVGLRSQRAPSAGEVP